MEFHFEIPRVLPRLSVTMVWLVAAFNALWFGARDLLTLGLLSDRTEGIVTGAALLATSLTVASLLSWRPSRQEG
jgi:hypothetical protein